jgi:hypothetical protein
LVGSVLDKGGVTEPYPLAVSGGELVGNPAFRDAVISDLGKGGDPPSRVTLVPDPVAGAILLAAALGHA